MSAHVRPPTRMTVEDFLAWADDVQGAWQLEDGEPVAMAAPSDMHGTIQSTLGALLFIHLRANRPHCRVVTTPGVVPRVRETTNVRVPDLVVACRPASPEERLMRDPILVAEILSTSNERETWSNVWTYCSIPSVQDILVLRSMAVGAELLSRLPGGDWPGGFTTLVGRDAELHLPSIDVRLRLGDLYAGTAFA